MIPIVKKIERKEHKPMMNGFGQLYKTLVVTADDTEYPLKEETLKVAPIDKMSDPEVYIYADKVYIICMETCSYNSDISYFEKLGGVCYHSCLLEKAKLLERKLVYNYVELNDGYKIPRFNILLMEELLK